MEVIILGGSEVCGNIFWLTLKWKIYFYKKCRKLVNEIRERKIQMNCASPFTNCSSRGEVVDSNCDVIVVLPKIKLKTSVPPYIKNNVLSPQCRG